MSDYCARMDAALQSSLRTTRFARFRMIADELASTMDPAHQLGDDGAPTGTLVVCESQKNGRGARGNIWQAETGASLTFSFVVRHPDLPPLPSLLAGLAVHRALLRESIESKVKWPNDLLVRGSEGAFDSKVGGILVEGRFRGDGSGHAVIGMGLNLMSLTREQEVPGELKRAALFDSVDVGRAASLLANIGAEFESLSAVARSDTRPVIAELQQALAWRGDEVETDDGFRGVVLGVTGTGELELQSQGETRRLHSGRIRRC